MENLTQKHLIHRALLSIYWCLVIIDYFVAGGSLLNAILSALNGVIYYFWTNQTHKLFLEGIILSNIRWYKWETSIFAFITFTNSFGFYFHAQSENIGLFLCFLYALGISIYFMYNLYNRKVTRLDTWLLGALFPSKK